MRDTYRRVDRPDSLLQDGMFSFKTVTTDERTGTTVAEYERGAGAPSMAVAAMVADRRGVDPSELDVVYNSIDPDALDAIFDDPRARLANAAVSFTYEGFDVQVNHDTIAITERC